MDASRSAHLRHLEQALLRVEDLVVEFPTQSGRVRAVSHVSLDLAPGETLGIVGESGSGKSSLARAIVQYPRPTSGSVQFQGQRLESLSPEQMRRARRNLQMIFQDPISSLNPRRKVIDIVLDPLEVWREGSAAQRREQAEEALRAVGLDPKVVAGRRPHQFSGGQCQRISIARALVLDPEILICDEPVSALDVSVQAQILNLLEAMKARYGLALVFISHDLAVVRNISDRVSVMYLGKLCEVGPTMRLFSSPAHPYTRLLLESVPTAGRRDIGSEYGASEVPSPISPPSGCRFRTRCPRATEVCATHEPEMRPLQAGHYVACHHPLVAVLPGEAPSPGGVTAGGSP